MWQLLAIWDSCISFESVKEVLDGWKMYESMKEWKLLVTGQALVCERRQSHSCREYCGSDNVKTSALTLFDEFVTIVLMRRALFQSESTSRQQFLWEEAVISRSLYLSRHSLEILEFSWSCHSFHCLLFHKLQYFTVEIDSYVADVWASSVFHW